VLIDPSFNPSLEGLGMGGFGYMIQHPFEMFNFHQTMLAVSKPQLDKIVGNYDFSRFQTIVDVGGSTGHLIKKVLTCFPNVPLGINFDIENVITGLELEREKDEVAVALGERYKLVSGDFFKEVAHGDCFVLKFIIHDWPDEEGVVILRNVYNAMNPGARVLLIENVMPNFGEKSGFFSLFC